MPGSIPATSQLEWLSSTTAMIVLFWSRATRDLLRSFGWGIAALHRENAATQLPCLDARPIASLGSAPAKGSSGRCQSETAARKAEPLTGSGPKRQCDVVILLSSARIGISSRPSALRRFFAGKPLAALSCLLGI